MRTFDKDRKLPLAKKSLKARFFRYELTDYAIATQSSKEKAFGYC